MLAKERAVILIFLQAGDMSWSAKYQKYVSILPLNITYRLTPWLIGNDHETYIHMGETLFPGD